MNDYDLMVGFGGPDMVYVAWFLFIVFIVLFTFGVMYLWNYLRKKED